tara:strand:+ start:93429 stop:93758 length:330 start_codon:yes stop_codon:yes gene_type:complete
MAKYSKIKVSEETQEKALKIARANQKPGQTKEQTKLIAQGIQKGIDQYKKQHKARARELNKQIKKVKNARAEETELEIQEIVQLKQHWLPWSLLVLSWTIFAAYIFLGN